MSHTKLKVLFFSHKQEPNESIDQYVTELKNRSKSCEFGDLTESLIKDKIVCGISDESLRESLLMPTDLTLEKAITSCCAKETTRQQAREVNGNNRCESANVDTVKGGGRLPQRKQQAKPPCVIQLRKVW